MSRHPQSSDLALYSSGDLNLLERWRVGRHTARCRQCSRDVEAFRNTSEKLALEAGEMPRELHWGKLAAEMKANIHLGMEAGRIAGGAEEPVGWFSWRPAAAMACIALMVVSGLWLNRPAPKPVTEAATAAASSDIVLLNTASGIEMASGGRAFALTYQDPASVTLSVGTQGSMRARYIDDDTFEVTIHHVYAH